MTDTSKTKAMAPTIQEWLMDMGIDTLTTITTADGEYYLFDVIEMYMSQNKR